LADDNDWLVGKWELTRDPDGNPKDWLEFSADGHASTTTAEGRRIPGRYVIKELSIEVVYSYNGKMIPLELHYSSNKDRLFAFSKQTKHTSEYQKVH
jgi:hypothetical protein